MRFHSAWLLLAALATGSTAHASLIAIDFEDIPATAIHNQNFERQGVRFSPNCHYDTPNSGGFADSQWIGFDTATCGTFFNENYVGPPAEAGALFVDYYGDTFSLLALFDVTSNYRIQSSKGGVLDTGFLTNRKTLAFNGDVWMNVEWLLFDRSSAGTPFGFDNLVLDVPAKVTEPSTLLLLTVGGVLVTRRRTRPLPCVQVPR